MQKVVQKVACFKSELGEAKKNIYLNKVSVSEL